MKTSSLLCAVCLWLFVGDGTCLASVVYDFRENGSTQVIGSLEIAAPPASDTLGWSATDGDLLALFLDDGVFGLGVGNLLVQGLAGFGSVESLTGARLDAGSLAFIVPLIPGDPTIARSISMSFDHAQGGDFIGMATEFTFADGTIVIGDLFLDGDWVARGVSVAEPGLLLVFGAGVYGLRGFVARRRSRLRTAEPLIEN